METLRRSMAPGGNQNSVTTTPGVFFPVLGKLHIYPSCGQTTQREETYATVGQHQSQAPLKGAPRQTRTPGSLDKKSQIVGWLVTHGGK